MLKFKLGFLHIEHTDRTTVLREQIMKQNFTKVETEVAKLVIKGMSNKEMGVVLHRSVPTIKVYIFRLSQKLNAKNRTLLVYLLGKIENKILNPNA